MNFETEKREKSAIDTKQLASAAKDNIVYMSIWILYAVLVIGALVRIAQDDEVIGIIALGYLFVYTCLAVFAHQVVKILIDIRNSLRK